MCCRRQDSYRLDVDHAPIFGSGAPPRPRAALLHVFPERHVWVERHKVAPFALKGGARAQRRRRCDPAEERHTRPLAARGAHPTAAALVDRCAPRARHVLGMIIGHRRRADCGAAALTVASARLRRPMSGFWLYSGGRRPFSLIFFKLFFDPSPRSGICSPPDRRSMPL